LEAVASGLPVVAVAAGALPELVDHGNNGYLVPPRDAQAAAEAVLSILATPDVRADMGRHSRTIAERHDVRASVEAYEALLETIVSGRRGDLQFERVGAAGS